MTRRRLNNSKLRQGAPNTVEIAIVIAVINISIIISVKHISY